MFGRVTEVGRFLFLWAIVSMSMGEPNEGDGVGMLWRVVVFVQKSFSVHCSNRDSEEGRTNGVTWHTVLCTTKQG